MARSRERGRPAGVDERLTPEPPRAALITINYPAPLVSAVTQREYDVLLASVPAPIALGAALGTVSSLPLMAAVGAGSLLASLLVGFAMFGLTP